MHCDTRLDVNAHDNLVSRYDCELITVPRLAKNESTPPERKMFSIARGYQNSWFYKHFCMSHVPLFENFVQCSPKTQHSHGGVLPLRMHEGLETSQMTFYIHRIDVSLIYQHQFS